MPKTSQIDQAISQLEQQREVIEAALAALTNLKRKPPVRRPRVVKTPEEKTA